MSSHHMFGTIQHSSSQPFLFQVRRKRSILMKRLNLTSVHSKDCRLHPSSDAAKKREELNGLDYREDQQS